MQRAISSFRTQAIATSILLSAVAAASGNAANINLSTGLDALNNVILTGNTPDAHWTVDQPLGGIAPAKVVSASDPGGAIPPWAANGPGSSWITINPNSIGNGSVIPYTYYRTFNLTAADLVTASMSGTWGIDDGGELRLNGYLLSSSPADYSATTTFSVGTGSGFFNLGLNTLTITMTSSDDFLEAVRLEGFLIPTPGAAALLGLGGVIAIRRRRSSHA